MSDFLVNLKINFKSKYILAENINKKPFVFQYSYHFSYKYLLDNDLLIVFKVYLSIFPNINKIYKKKHID